MTPAMTPPAEIPSTTAKGVYRHRATHDQGLQHVCLKLHNGDNQTERDQRKDKPLGQQGDRHGEGSRKDGANERDEGTQKPPTTPAAPAESPCGKAGPDSDGITRATTDVVRT